MDQYSVGARTTAQSTVGRCGAALWNPSSAVPVWVRRCVYFQNSSLNNGQYGIQRITARGNATTTVTPDIDSHRDATVAPPSGTVLDLGWTTTQPTVDASVLEDTTIDTNANGQGFIFLFPSPIRLAPGSGLALVLTSGTAMPAGDVVFDWQE